MSSYGGQIARSFSFTARLEGGSDLRSTGQSARDWDTDGLTDIGSIRFLAAIIQKLVSRLGVRYVRYKPNRPQFDRRWRWCGHFQAARNIDGCTDPIAFGQRLLDRTRFVGENIPFAGRCRVVAGPIN